MNKVWIAAMLSTIVALPFCKTSDDDNRGFSDAGADSDTDSDTDSDSATDCDTDADAESTVVVTLNDDTADAGLDAGGFIDNCENTLGGPGDTSYAWGDGGYIQWGIKNNVSRFQGVVNTQWGAPTSPGTYIIDAKEADYETCGICLLVLSPDFSTAYMPVADSGSITFNDYSVILPVGGEFSGTFDVIMQEVDIDSSSFATTPVVGGCKGFLAGTWSGTVGDFPDGK